MAVLRCSASVAAKTVECASDAPAASAARLSMDMLVGGQGVNVKLTSTGVTYDAGSQTFSADVSVQNLLDWRMGSDGATESGVRVFFASYPVALGAGGVVEVKNEDGSATFNEGYQPYFEYTGTLGPGETSKPKRWEWTIAPSVQAFSFTLLVQTKLVPAVVFDMMVSGNRDIYRIGIDGRDLTRLTRSPGDDRDPTVAGKSVVFTSYRDGNAELYRVPLRGGGDADAGVVRLTSTTDNETSPALSPDGTRLAFVRGNLSVLGKLWTAPADSIASAKQPTSGLGFGGDLETSPAWADETRLAFVSTSLGSADLFDLSSGGSPARMLSQSDQYADIDPAWRADGKVIFASNRTPGGDTELYLLDPSAGGVTRVTTRSGSDSAPSWLTGDLVVFSCYQGTRGSRLCWVNLSSPGTVTEIATPAAADRPAAAEHPIIRAAARAAAAQ